MHRQKTIGWDQLFLLTPVLLLLLLTFVMPLVDIVPQAFAGNAGERFLRIMQSPIYRAVMLATVRISLEATAITLVVSFPLAWILSRATGMKRLLLGLLVLVPFLTNVLVRTFAWLAILGQRRLINVALQSLGLISKPLPLLFSEPAVVLALVHSSIPMMIFALVSVLRRIDERILLAARTLGASRSRAWLGTLIPLAVRAIQSGVIIVFLYTTASFVAPAMLGNQRQQMLAQVIQSEIEQGSDWGFAAALGVTLAITATFIVAALSLIGRHFSRWQRPTPPAGTGAFPDSTGDVEHLRQGIAPRVSKIRFPVVAHLLARAAEPLYLIVMSAFILLPLVVLVPISFSTADVLVFPPPGYSLRWFHAIIGSPEWGAAALTSLRIAGATCVATVAIAIPTVLGFGRQFRFRGAAEAIVLLPLTIPTVVYALGAYLSFSRIGLVDTELGIIIAHTILSFPTVFLVLSATYSSIDPGLSLAAASLGASPSRVFRTVVLPLLLPGIAVAALLALLLSFDESVASIFLSNMNVQTLPRKLWEAIRFNSSPESAAVSVMLLGVSGVVITVCMLVVLARQKKASLSLAGPTGAPPT